MPTITSRAGAMTSSSHIVTGTPPQRSEKRVMPTAGVFAVAWTLHFRSRRKNTRNGASPWSCPRTWRTPPVNWANRVPTAKKTLLAGAQSMPASVTWKERSSRPTTNWSRWHSSDDARWPFQWAGSNIMERAAYRPSPPAPNGKNGVKRKIEYQPGRQLQCLRTIWAPTKNRST